MNKNEGRRACLKLLFPSVFFKTIEQIIIMKVGNFIFHRITLASFANVFVPDYACNLSDLTSGKVTA